tara:strand:- start:646 stop:807 length:162 start_codon:yes stop_codon:yes gene_type:complete
MPKIGKKKYPYTEEGMKKFKEDKKKAVQQAKRGQSAAEMPVGAKKKKMMIGKK